MTRCELDGEGGGPGRQRQWPKVREMKDGAGEASLSLVAPGTLLPCINVILLDLCRAKGEIH